MIFLLVKYIRKAQIGQLKALIKECYTKYFFSCIEVIAHTRNKTCKFI